MYRGLSVHFKVDNTTCRPYEQESRNIDSCDTPGDHRVRRLAAYLWTSPNTLLGLLIAAPDLIARRHVRRVRGVLEVAGPWVRLLLRRATLLKGGARAITFGHVVLAITPEALDQTRDHERVHVAQYERWGPLFIAAYLTASLVAWVKGGDPYRDNRFEREAFDRTVGP